jgi:aspartyl-tRNA(Asn)/glutamyl-tRNA(Gln) amidotransferase subunit A
LTPTTPQVAFPFGSKIDDPIEMYMCDLCSIPSSLAGHPALSVPFALSDEGLPIGVQVLAPALGEAVMMRVGASLEAAVDAGVRGPVTP